MHTRIQTVISLLAGAGILLICHFIGAPLWMQSFFVLFPIIAAGFEAGRYLLSQEHPIVRSVWGCIAIIAVLMLIRGVWFYLGFNLNGWGEVMPEVILFITSAVIVTVLGARGEGRGMNAGFNTLASRSSLLTSLFPLLVSLLSFSLIAYVSYRAGTDQSIRTPWPLLPAWVLPIIGMQWIFLIVGAWKLRNRWVTAFQSSLAIASTSIIVPLVYKIGYGFDGFLHVAGETVLSKTGTLLPHPMYYMGQYVFTTWIARLADVDIALIDRWLVPACAALLLPLAVLIRTNHNQSLSRFAALLFIPLSPFIVTTPHGFSIILACTAMILAISATNRDIHPALPILLSLWCVLTHPLVGLPILGATTALAFHKKGHAVRATVAFLIAVGGSIAVPLMFGLAATLGSSGGVNFDIHNFTIAEKWQTIFSSWIPWVQNRYAIWAETSVWIEKLLPWILVIFALAERIKRWKQKEATPPWLAASIGAGLSALVLTIAGDFGFLIDYERGNYADRLWLVALILLFPLALPAIGNAFDRIKKGRIASLAGTLAAIGILAAGVSYAALPRHDAVTPSRGWSVGLADIEAVKLINDDSNDEPYTVLANQSVSAAAVKTFGFKRYNGDVFFYPIPTGGSLYEVFLKASYGNPSRKTMQEAAKLGGSNLVYFVVNDYWWKSDELIELAKKDASRVFTIQNGKVMVFKYEVGSR